MKITLVHVPRPEYAGGQLRRTFIMIMPVGLLGLADALDRDGHDVEVLHLGLARLRDPAFELAAHLGRRGSELVGFSLHWHHQLHGVLQQARGVREASGGGVRVVLGGLTASFFAEQLLARFDFLDLVVRGDGELPLRRLAAGDDPATVPNVAFRSGPVVVAGELSYHASPAQLDRLDLVRLDLLRDAELYSARWFLRPGDDPRSYASNKVFYLCGGRGCSVGCAFCGGSAEAHRLLSGRTGLALRSPRRLAEDALKAAAAGYQTLYLCFDPPGLPPQHYLRFFELMRRMGSGQALIFECYGLPSGAFVDAFAGSFEPGGSQLAFSPDSADEATRRRVKGYHYSNARLLRCLERCTARGIRSTCYFTLMPGDDWSAVRRLRRFQQTLRQNFGSQLMTLPIELEPAAAWQLHPERHGLSGGPDSYDLDYFLDRHRRVSTPPGPATLELAHLHPEAEKMLEYLDQDRDQESGGRG